MRYSNINVGFKCLWCTELRLSSSFTELPVKRLAFRYGSYYTIIIWLFAPWWTDKRQYNNEWVVYISELVSRKLSATLLLTSLVVLSLQEPSWHWLASRSSRIGLGPVLRKTERDLEIDLWKKAVGHHLDRKEFRNATWSGLSWK